MRRAYSQIQSQTNSFISILNTAWLYPEADIAAALATTTYSYTYDETTIVCPTLADIIGVYGDIYTKTTISQPVGSNPGFSIGAGTLLEDMGKELRFCLPGGEVVIIWRLVRQLTPQRGSTVIPVPGDSPNGTIGYTTTFCSYGSGANGGYSVGLDDVQVLRLG